MSMPEPLTFEFREVRAQFMEASIPEQTRRDLAVCEAMDRLDVTVELMRQMVDLVLSVRRSIDEGTDRDQILLRWSASNELLRGLLRDPAHAGQNRERRVPRRAWPLAQPTD